MECVREEKGRIPKAEGKTGIKRRTWVTSVASGGSRVLDVVQERTSEAADQLWETLTPEQKQTVEAVAVDMWEPFIRTIEKQVPEADIVHDKFHVSKYS